MTLKPSLNPPKRRITCFSDTCRKRIKDTEDYVIIKAVYKGKTVKVNYHEKCLKEDIDELFTSADTLVKEIKKEKLFVSSPHTCTACGKKINKGYVILEWVGKTWGFERFFHPYCAVIFVRNCIANDINIGILEEG